MIASFSTFLKCMRARPRGVSPPAPLSGALFKKSRTFKYELFMAGPERSGSYDTLAEGEGGGEGAGDSFLFPPRPTLKRCASAVLRPDEGENGVTRLSRTRESICTRRKNLRQMWIARAMLDFMRK